MRWEDLFADLEGRARALAQGETWAEVADRTRGETAQVSLVNRLRAQIGRPVTIVLSGAGEVTGTLSRVGPDHLLVDGGGAAYAGEHLVVMSAVLSVTDLAPGAVAETGVGVVEARLGLAAVLRGLAADRSPVGLTRCDGNRCHGTLSRVGADWVDLDEHAQGDVPRPDRIVRRRTVPFSALAVLHRSVAW